MSTTSTDFGYSGYGFSGGGYAEPAETAQHEETIYGAPEPADETPAADQVTATDTGRSADEPDDQHDGDEHDETTGAKKSARKGGNANRALVRRTAAKAVEVAAVEEEQRKVLASILGTKNDVVSLTTAVMTAERGSTRAVSDVRELLSQDGDMQRAVKAMELSADGHLKDAWSVLVNLGVVSGQLPSSDSKAALLVAEKVGALDAGMVTDALDSVLELAKRW